jgi:SAM-dependent methyltransferase
MHDESAWREANRLSWNAATRVHNAHKVDQAGFLRGGGSTLFPEELELLGDVVGNRVVHLQCNAGQDSLSLAALGAVVTGVDISDEAIEFARGLSRESGIEAEFERADAYEWLERAAREANVFDIAFASYGFLCWLHDLDAWARAVAGVLRPGGRFVCVEFHPLLGVFDESLRATGDYFKPRGPRTWDDGVSDYVGASGGALSPSGHRDGAPFVNPHPSVEFEWRIEDVLSALAGAELILERFREYPFVNGDRFFDGMEEQEGRRFVMPEWVAQVPLMYGISARRS